MYITQQDAQDIIDGCSKEMLKDFEYFYSIDSSFLKDRLLTINNHNYANTYIPKKDKIDFCITSNIEGRSGNTYRQFYFMIMEQGKTSPHYMEKLQRTKI